MNIFRLIIPSIALADEMLSDLQVSCLQDFRLTNILMGLPQCRYKFLDVATDQLILEKIARIHNFDLAM